MATKKAKTFNFDDYVREARAEPFVLKADGQEIVIPAPTSETVMLIEEAGTTRRALSLICGEQWEHVEALISDKPGAVAVAMATDMANHFGLNGDAAPPAASRASSR